jgi:mxaD protein
LNTWHPAVAKDEIVEGKNDSVGAVRLLTLKDGGTIKEKLLAFEPKARKFRYAILEGRAAGQRLHLDLDRDLRGRQGQVHGHLDGPSFRRKDTGDSPADNANDKTATDTITGVYQGGIAESEEDVGRGLAPSGRP